MQYSSTALKVLLFYFSSNENICMPNIRDHCKVITKSFSYERKAYKGEKKRGNPLLGKCQCGVMMRLLVQDLCKSPLSYNTYWMTLGQ